MSNIIRIRKLEEEVKMSNVVIPVDKETYTSDCKQISILDLKTYILSKFKNETYTSNWKLPPFWTVGGISAGDSRFPTGFTNVPVSQMFDWMLYPIPTTTTLSPTTTTTTTSVPTTTTTTQTSTTTLPPTTTTTTTTGVPIVFTIVATNITATSAESGCNVISDGGSIITFQGVCWNTGGEPTIYNNIGSTIGFVNPLIITNFPNGLFPLTTYYYIAFANNANGLSYGLEHSFTTLGLYYTIEIYDSFCTFLGSTTISNGSNIPLVQGKDYPAPTEIINVYPSAAHVKVISDAVGGDYSTFITDPGYYICALCYSYNITSGTIGQIAYWEYINCDGSPGNISTGYGGSSTICVQQGTLVNTPDSYGVATIGSACS